MCDHDHIVVVFLFPGDNMWVLFNRDYGENLRDDLVDMDDEEAKVLVEEKICQKITDVEEVSKNLQNKKLIETTK